VREKVKGVNKMKTVTLTYEEFCKIKKQGYSKSIIIYFACKKLGIKEDDIDDIDFDYKLKFNVYLKEKTNEQQNFNMGK
jgi:hypothetical protein